MKTKLRATRPKSAPKGSEKVEAFIIEIERKLLTEFSNSKQPKPSERAIRIENIMKKLKEKEEVIILTDKKNSFNVIKIQNYKNGY